MRNCGSCIVSWDFNNEKNTGILLVGIKKPNEAVEVINAFQGDEARKIYSSLIKKEN